MKITFFKRISLLLFLIVFSTMSNINAQNFQKTSNGVSVPVNGLNVSIEFYSPETVRVLKSPIGNDFEKKSHSVIKTPESVNVSLSENENQIIISSSKLKVYINRKNGAVSFISPEEKSLLVEKDYGAQFTSIKDVNEDSYVVRQSYVLDKDEEIYGLGQFQDGNMSQRNQKLHLLQEILITAVPVMQSSKGYGVFWDNYSPTDFTDSVFETSFESRVGDCVDYYFMYGGNSDGVVKQIRNLTGQAPMFPYWTYGYWQSKERYKSQQEALDVVKKYRTLGVPIDGLIQDWQYWGDNSHWNGMEFLNPEFPNPKKMIDEVHNLNAHVIFSIWSSFGPKTKPFKELNEKGLLFDFKTWPLTEKNIWPQPKDAKKSGVRVYDAFNPDARDIYWKYLNKGIFSLGNDGWWMDSTEPDHFEREDKDYDEQTYLGSFRKYRNLYPLKTVGGVYDHQRATSDDKRVFILTRSAFAGQQRYGANSWSGDVTANWPHFKNQIAAGLNFSLTGIPYWNTDIGGFFLWNYPETNRNSAYKELYVRWLQYGAFCPMMRSHGTDGPREIYQFGEKGTWAYDAIEKFINLRYRLLPYIYATSWDVTANSSSMIRALVMDFADDKKALDINDEYMFGKSLLVCPVTDPMYVEVKKEDNRFVGGKEDFNTTKSREVYLPANTKWTDFWTGKTYDGGQTIQAEAPIDIMPLYVKSGAILPMGPLVQYATEKINAPIEIRIYPGADGEFVLYDDEKDNYNYEKGKYALVKLTWDDQNKSLTIGKRQGSFAKMKKTQKFNIVLVNSKNGIGDKPSKTFTKTITYKGKEKTIQL